MTGNPLFQVIPGSALVLFTVKFPECFTKLPWLLVDPRICLSTADEVLLVVAEEVEGYYVFAAWCLQAFDGALRGLGVGESIELEVRAGD